MLKTASKKNKNIIFFQAELAKYLAVLHVFHRMQYSKRSGYSLHDAQGRKYIGIRERRALLECVARMDFEVRAFTETLAYTGDRISEALS